MAHPATHAAVKLQIEQVPEVRAAFDKMVATGAGSVAIPGTVRGNVLGVRGVGFAGYCAVSEKVKIGHAFGMGMSLTRNLSTKRISCG